MPTVTTEQTAHSEYGSGEYVLANTHLFVTGIGESRNQQQANVKSRTAALDSAMSVLRGAVVAIATERGFQPPPMDEFQFVNTKTIDRHTTAFDNDKGVRIYRNTQTLSIEIEPPLRDIFDQMDAGDDYNWYMFLRDIDRQLNLKKADNDD